MRRNHRHSPVDDDVGDDEFKVKLYYNTLTLERRRERIRYDLPELFSAIGGSLGLLIGFSILNVIWLGLDAAGKAMMALGVSGRKGL